MLIHPYRRSSCVLMMWACAVPAAHAQWAVVDAPAIVQLVRQVQTMGQQLSTARDQLAEAQRALQSMTGDRGMGRLLGGVSRNYLPSSGPQLTGAVLGTGNYPGLSSDIENAVGAVAVLSPQQLSVLSSVDQQRVTAGRRTYAVRQALADEALANTSGRFLSLQTLVAAISSAGDQKAILDLQARIAVELGMLENEQTKLQVLHQATEAQETMDKQQEREQIIAGHGSFADRFRPAPQYVPPRL
jgi:type IV secretion system protein VirB5